ncbi:hypothetical protein ACX6XY_08470 [Streptomyces sp. O3]
MTAEQQQSPEQQDAGSPPTGDQMEQQVDALQEEIKRHLDSLHGESK